MTTNENERRRRWRNYVLLAASTLTVMSGAPVSPTLPALQRHFADVPDAALLTRMVLTMPGFFIALMAPVAGYIADRFGRTRLLSAATLIFGAAGASVLWLDSLPSILVGRALVGLATGCIMTTTVALASDYFVDGARAHFVGLQSGVMALGGLGFVILGGYLAEFHWRVPYAIYFAAFALVPPMIRHLPEPASHRHTPEDVLAPPPRLSRRDLLFIAGIYAVVGGHSILFFMIPMEIPFLLPELGADRPGQAGIAIGVISLVAGAVSTRYGWLRARFSHPAIYVVVFAFMASGFALLALAKDFSGVVLGLAVAGLGAGLNMVNASVWLMANTPARARGRVLGGLTTSIFFAQGMTPFPAEWAIAAHGFQWLFAAGALFLALFAIGFSIASLGGRWRAPQG